MPTITEVADNIIAEDLPALFVDTCILLDVIRSIKRKYANCATQALGLHQAATVAPRRCIVVVSHLVQHEWGVHEQELLDEATRHLIDLQEHSGHFHDACDALGIAPGFGRSEYAAHNMAVRLRDLSHQLLDCGIVVDSDNECSGRAIDRVIYNVPPSKKGGEAKDCTILEEYLAVARRLHDVGFQKKRVFCTSNTNDYCEAGGLHTVLAAEFAPINFRFTSNLAWGFHDVTH
jgi:hypothetical protein